MKQQEFLIYVRVRPKSKRHWTEKQMAKLMRDLINGKELPYDFDVTDARVTECIETRPTSYPR